MITQWHIRPGIDGQVELQTWQLGDLMNREATLKGTVNADGAVLIGMHSLHDNMQSHVLNLIAVVADAGQVVTIEIPEKNRQLPVDTGMAIGFLPLTEDFIFYRENTECEVPNPLGCEFGYLVHDMSFGIPLDYDYDVVFQFESGGNALGFAREYGIGVTVDPGTKPVLENLPATIAVSEGAAVNDVLFTVVFSDAEVLQTLQIYVVETVPNEDNFVIDATGMWLLCLWYDLCF